MAPIPPVRDPVPEAGRVAVLRALPGLGDLLCAVPALRALRRARPDVELTYIGLPETEPLVRRYSAYVDRFLAFPGFPGLLERTPDLAAIPEFLRDAQAQRWDLVIQLHGSGTFTNTFVELLGARRTAGHVPLGMAAPDRSTYLPWNERASEIRRSLRLMAHLGWPSDDEALEFTIAPGTPSPAVAPGYVVIHPGASAAARRWAAAGFAEVANALAGRGERIVLTGSRDEIGRNRDLARLLDVPPMDLTGRTSLDELGEVLRHARLLVSNDTGVAHLAVALDVPSVVVFTGSDRDRWGPLDTERHRPVPGSAHRVIVEATRLLGDRSTGPRRAAERETLGDSGRTRHLAGHAA